MQNPCSALAIKTGLSAQPTHSKPICNLYQNRYNYTKTDIKIINETNTIFR